jgi:hypothetical protein
LQLNPQVKVQKAKQALRLQTTKTPIILHEKTVTAKRKGQSGFSA